MYPVTRCLSVYLPVSVRHTPVLCQNGKTYQVFHNLVATPNVMTMFRPEPPKGGGAKAGDMEKIDFSAISRRFISETMQDRTIVTVECE